MKSSKKRCSRTLITLVLIISMLIQAIAFRCEKADAASSYTIEIVNSKLEVFPVSVFSATSGSYLLSYTSKLPKAPDGYYRWWYDKSTGQQIVSTTKVTKSMTIYPVDKPNSNTIVFVTNEKGDGKGTSKAEITKTGMTFSQVIKDPTATGKIFLGWSAKPDGSSGVFKPEHKLVVNSSIPSKLYGIWFDTHDKWTEYKKTVTYLVSPEEFYNVVKAERTVLDYKKKNTKVEKTLFEKSIDIKLKEAAAILFFAGFAATGGTAAVIAVSGLIVSAQQSDWDKYCTEKEINTINSIYSNRESRVTKLEKIAKQYKTEGHQQLVKLTIETYWKGLEAHSRTNTLFYGKLIEKIVAVDKKSVQ